MQKHRGDKIQFFWGKMPSNSVRVELRVGIVVVKTRGSRVLGRSQLTKSRHREGEFEVYVKAV